MRRGFGFAAPALLHIWQQPSTLRSTKLVTGKALIEPSQIQALYAALAAVSACIACVFDIRDRRIPNRLTGPALLAGLLAHIYFAGWRGLADAVAAAALAGFIFLLFNLAGGMGAGDVKLIAASAAMIGLHPLGVLVISLALAGGLFAIVTAMVRGVLWQSLANASALVAHHRLFGLTPHPELNLQNPKTVRLPFAVPIAAGCIYTLGVALVQR